MRRRVRRETILPYPLFMIPPLTLKKCYIEVTDCCLLKHISY
jgi:hypothetical protein